jgi:hypothetical protein
MEKTQWFPVAVKPKRVGVYETMTRLGNFYNYFDGKRWHWGRDVNCGIPSAQEAAKWNVIPRKDIGGVEREWRGLAAPVERGDKS